MKLNVLTLALAATVFTTASSAPAAQTTIIEERRAPFGRSKPKAGFDHHHGQGARGFSPRQHSIQTTAVPG